MPTRRDRTQVRGPKPSQHELESWPVPDKTVMLDEYRELGENARLLTTTRLASLTISFAFQAALVSALMQSANTGALREMLKVIAILLAVLSAAMEYRIITIFSRTCYRAAFLEERLGFYNYRHIQISDWRPVTIRNALVVLHVGLLVFWTVAILLRV